MAYESVLDKVIEFFARLPNGDAETITADTTLGDTVLVDSMTVLEVVLFLESEFDIALERSDLDRIHTPTMVADLIVEKGGAAR